MCGKLWYWCTEVDQCLVVFVCQRSTNMKCLSGVFAVFVVSVVEVQCNGLIFYRALAEL